MGARPGPRTGLGRKGPIAPSRYPAGRGFHHYGRANSRGGRGDRPCFSALAAVRLRAAQRAHRRHHGAQGRVRQPDSQLQGPRRRLSAASSLDLTQSEAPFDAVFVPLGNGSLVNGVGTWLKHASPQTRVIAVCAASAPSMALSWKARQAIDAPSSTIADGIAVRVPVREAVDTMGGTVD